MFRRIIISFISFFLLAGCGQDTAAVSKTIESADDLKAILASHLNQSKEESANVLISLLHLDPESVIDAKAVFEEGNTGKMAIVILSKDSDTALETSDQLNYYLTTLKNSAAQYNPEALELINNGYIYTKDNVSVLVISDDISSVKTDLANYFAN